MPTVPSVLITATEVKNYIFGSSSGTNWDTLIGQLITQAVAYITAETKIILTSDDSAYDSITGEITNGTGGREIYTAYKPVREVSKIEIKFDDTWTEYTDETASDIDCYDDVIFPKSRLGGREKRILRIAYKAGYKTSEVPADLKLCAILLVSGLYNARNMVGFGTQSVGGLSVSLSNDDFFLVRKILTKYKPVRVYDV